jgi:hypothetical protein
MSKNWDDFKLGNGKTVGFMRKDNLKWWLEEGINSEKPSRRVQYYEIFFENIKKVNKQFDFINYKNKIIGEVCGGPFGGIIESHLPLEQKYQIDIFASDFEKLNWIKSPIDKTTWIESPCEQIELPDNHLDVLFGFNSIDHGWDYKSALKECIRVSKECYISFDTNRYKNPSYPDLNHYQIVDYDDVIEFVESLKNDNLCIHHWYRNQSIPDGTIKIFGMWAKKV